MLVTGRFLASVSGVALAFPFGPVGLAGGELAPSTGEGASMECRLESRSKAGVARGSVMGLVALSRRRGSGLGGGKVPLRSMASTVRWKRRKRASALERVASRSIVSESSLTGSNVSLL
jgi:hypothetical protein